MFPLPIANENAYPVRKPLTSVRTNHVPALSRSLYCFPAHRVGNLHALTQFTEKETEAQEAKRKAEGRPFPRPQRNEGMEFKFKSLEIIMHHGQGCGH